jgi:hypothetical protein
MKKFWLVIVLYIVWCGFSGYVAGKISPLVLLPVVIGNGMLGKPVARLAHKQTGEAQ